MRDYGIVSPQFWIGETGRSIRGDLAAQVLALYLITSPHATMTGLFHCPVLYMAHETGLPVKGASKALRSLCEGGFCAYDEASEVVFVTKMASFQLGASLKPGDNRIVGIERELAKMPESRMKSMFLDAYAAAFHLQVPAHSAHDTEAPCKPLRSQDQEQDQEQEQEQPPKPPKGVDERFERFWASCPKKVGKDAARKAFRNRKPDDAMADRMIGAMAEQARSDQWRKDGGQYIPNPATWLNQGRWQDEVNGSRDGWESFAAGAL